MIARQLILLCLLVLFPFAAAADDATDRATDIAQMKRVWEALMSFKKAKGALPESLSDLVPGFLADPKLLVSPKQKDAGPDAPFVPRTEKHLTSYVYEWGPRSFGNLSFTEVKTCQLEEYGSIVPLIRCFLHGKVLNVSHAGEFYETEIFWETSPAVKEWIKKHGLGPGASKGKFLEIITTDETGAPIQGVAVTAASRQIEGVPLPDRPVTTDAAGKARMPFGPVPSRQGILSFAAERHFAMPIICDAAGFPETLTVKMTFARRAGGVIRDAAGRPVAGAQVHLRRLQPPDPPPEGPGFQAAQRIVLGGAPAEPDRIALLESGASGEWKVSSLPADAHGKVEVTVSHPDFRVVKRRVGDPGFTVELLFEEKGDFVLRDPIVLRGQLSATDGTPIEGATIFFSGSPDVVPRTTLPTPPETKSGPHGAFEFTARIPGDSKLVALPKKGPPILHAFVLTDDPEPVKLTPPAARVITGRVIDTSGLPVPGVPIFFTGWQTFPVSEQPRIATTGPDGAWTWDQAPPGLVIGSAVLPSGNLRQWREMKDQPILIKIPLVDRE